jgi:hypothetical protein
MSGNKHQMATFLQTLKETAARLDSNSLERGNKQITPNA